MNERHNSEQLARSNKGIVLLLSLMTVGLAACNGGGDATTQGQVLGTDQVNQSPAPIPGGNTDGSGSNPVPAPTSAPPPPSSAAIGPRCSTSDPNRICLALKYIAYTDSNGTPTVSESDVLANLDTINQIWAQCSIQFQVDHYEAIAPDLYNLAFNTSSLSSLDTIRSRLEDSSTLLVVTTGAWSGTLGAGAANAWTNMPGASHAGVILEEPVGKFGPIVAHELGHYLNLDHVSDSSDVMSPVIYSTSTQLSSTQCSAARSAAQYYWTAMRR